MDQGIGVVLLLPRTYLVPGGSEEWRAAQRSFRRRLITSREFGLTGTCDVVVSDSISWYVIATAKLLRSWCGNDSVRLGWGGGEKGGGVEGDLFFSWRRRCTRELDFVFAPLISVWVWGAGCKEGALEYQLIQCLIRTTMYQVCMYADIGTSYRDHSRHLQIFVLCDILFARPNLYSISA